MVDDNIIIWFKPLETIQFHEWNSLSYMFLLETGDEPQVNVLARFSKIIYRFNMDSKELDGVSSQPNTTSQHMQLKLHHTFVNFGWMLVQPLGWKPEI